MDSLTDEWVEVFETSKANGEDIAKSFFFRMALFGLPLGVNPDDERVVAALNEIRVAVEGKG